MGSDLLLNQCKINHYMNEQVVLVLLKLYFQFHNLPLFPDAAKCCSKTFEPRVFMLFLDLIQCGNQLIRSVFAQERYIYNGILACCTSRSAAYCVAKP